jgi:predicted Co/Zn/Cd cation transporter (cation efflux family)
MPTEEELQQQIDSLAADKVSMQQQIDSLTSRLEVAIIWRSKFVQLHQVIDATRQFPVDYDFEANADSLIIDAGKRTNVLAQIKVKQDEIDAENAALEVARSKIKAGDFIGLTTAEKNALRNTM